MKRLRWTTQDGERVTATPFMRDGAPHVTLSTGGKAITMRVTPFVLGLIGCKLEGQVRA